MELKLTKAEKKLRTWVELDNEFRSRRSDTM
jgi:hypothetical protein